MQGAGSSIEALAGDGKWQKTQHKHVSRKPNGAYVCRIGSTFGTIWGAEHNTLDEAIAELPLLKQQHKQTIGEVAQQRLAGYKRRLEAQRSSDAATAEDASPSALLGQSTSSSQAELARLQDTQKDMVSKLASVERELAQLRASSRTAEFELLGQQQEVAAKLQAAQQQLNYAQARAAAEGNRARERLSQIEAQLSAARANVERACSSAQAAQQELVKERSGRLAAEKLVAELRSKLDTMNTKAAPAEF